MTRNGFFCVTSRRFSCSGRWLTCSYHIMIPLNHLSLSNSSMKMCKKNKATNKGNQDEDRVLDPATDGRSRDIGVGVLDRQTYQGGTWGSRLCGEDRDRETENSKVCARTRDTRFIQVRATKVASPTSCLGDQVWRPALGVGLSPEGLGMCG
jgi:hypothetical protein